MKKNLVFVFVLILMGSSFLMAQAKISVQVGMAFPSGNFSNVATNGYGVGGTIEFKQDELLSVCAFIGYYTWGPYTVWYLGPSDSYSNFQVMIGLRYAFSQQKVHPYMGLDIGMNSLSYSRTTYYGYTSTTTQLTQGRIGAAPVFGVIFKVNTGLNLDINFKYNFTSQELYNANIFPTSFFVLNAGLRFDM